jgi:hypothetical protein
MDAKPETTMDDIEQEILAVMRDQGVDRDEAETVVGMRRGELLGNGDILFMRSLTDAQKRRLGLGRTIHEVVAADRARENGAEVPATASAMVDRST